MPVICQFLCHFIKESFPFALSSPKYFMPFLFRTKWVRIVTNFGKSPVGILIHLQRKLPNMALEITPEIHSALERLEDRREKLLELGKAMMEASNRAMYPVDLLAIGALKRTISTVAGIKQLIQASNMICVRTILRTQIDTALKFYSVYLVKDSQSHALKILSGNQIDRIKDSDGKQMTDAYLVQKMSEEYPWVSDVYKNLSSYINFSDRHFFNPVQRLDNENRSIDFAIQEEFPESSWVEIVDCLNGSIDILIKYLEWWIFTKANPELIAEKREDRNGEPINSADPEGWDAD